MTSIYDDIGEIETRLTQLAVELEDLRERGFVHSGRLEDRIVAFDAHWDELQPKVEQSLQQHVRRLDSEMNTVERRVDALASPSASAVSAAETAVSGFQRKLSAAESAVQALYGNVQQELWQIDRELDLADWMLDQIEASQEIELYDTEGPVFAGEAEWQQDGEEGPDGVLILTDQRLIFEQKEEVAKKKFLGLVTTETEKIQRLLLDFPAIEIDTIETSKEGGFLGMGKDDIMEMTCTGNAPHSRLRFHLKDGKPDDWAAILKKVKNGSIDDERADEYVEELEEAEETKGSFPSQCTNCFAPLEAPPRGVTTVTCEFCGSGITAQAA